MQIPLNKGDIITVNGTKGMVEVSTMIDVQPIIEPSTKTEDKPAKKVEAVVAEMTVEAKVKTAKSKKK